MNWAPIDGKHDMIARRVAEGMACHDPIEAAALYLQRANREQRSLDIWAVEISDGGVEAIAVGLEREVAVREQEKARVGMDERIGADKRSNTSGLGAGAAQQGLTRWHRGEEVADGPGGATRAGCGACCGWALGAGDDDMSHAAIIVGAGNLQLRDGGDAGQRLATEAERGDVLQVGQGRDFARGVLRAGQWEIVGDHAAAVVGDTNEAQTAVAQLNANGARIGIQRVVYQLAHD